MASLARFLSNRVDGPVQDLTGLTGKYDIDISWTPDRTMEPLSSDAADHAAAGLFTAIRESLGLKLESRKTQVETIVIDHIERIPTGN